MARSGEMIAKKRTLTCMAVFIFVFAVLLCGMPRDAYGVSFSKDKTFGNVWTVAPTGDGIGRFEYITFDEVEDGATIKNLKSSNKKVATVSKGTDAIFIDYGSKTGSTTISCTVNGVKLKKVFRVKYVSPVKSFKVAGKTITSKFRKKNILRTGQTTVNKKATIVAKNGWTITEILNVKNFKRRTYTYKTGKKSVSLKIKTVAPSDGLRVTFKNTKTGVEQEIDYLRNYDGTGYSPVAG